MINHDYIRHDIVVCIARIQWVSQMALWLLELKVASDPILISESQLALESEVTSAFMFFVITLHDQS